jgi:heme-degrading monooxygenase HmoA
VYARVTLVEIDTMRATVDGAVGLFDREVLPELQSLDGYRGVYVLATPEGKAALVSLWDTADQADVDGRAGFYNETLARYVTLFASPPGRERYEVVLADVPAVDTANGG